jgi:hypothetical protein
MDYPKYKVILHSSNNPTYNIYYYYYDNGSIERNLHSMHKSLEDALIELSKISKSIEIVLAFSEESIYD